MIWVQLVIAVINLVREIIKLMQKEGVSLSDCVVEIKEATDAVKSASKSKDTRKLENTFASLNLGGSDTSSK